MSVTDTPTPAVVLCKEPSDLHRPAAREVIGRLLEGWLARQTATPFDLLHRLDLAVKLEEAGAELQHAFQKAAVPLALARSVSVHEVIRGLHATVDKAIARLKRDHAQGLLPVIGPADFATACAEHVASEELVYRLGAGVSGFAAGADWGDKLDALLTLLAAAPTEGPARKLALRVLEEPLLEICNTRGGLDSLVGATPDLSDELLARMRLAHGKAMEVLDASAPSRAAGQTLPPVGVRLAGALDRNEFPILRTALSRRVLAEFSGRRRLKPDSAAGEIRAVRDIAMALTVASGGDLPAEEVGHAIVGRCRALTDIGFVETLMAEAGSLSAELAALVTLLESAVGDANRRRALQWLEAKVVAPRTRQDLAGLPQGKAVLDEMLALSRRADHASRGIPGRETLLDALGDLTTAIAASLKGEVSSK